MRAELSDAFGIVNGSVSNSRAYGERARVCGKIGPLPNYS